VRKIYTAFAVSESVRSTVRWAAFAVLAVVAIALAAGILGSTVEVSGSSGLSPGSGGDSGQSGGLFENNESDQATQSLPINFPQQQVSLCVSAASNPAVLLGLGAAYLLVGSVVARLRTKLLGVAVVMIAVYVTVVGALLLTIGCNPPDLSFDGGGGLGASEIEGDEVGTGGDDADGPEAIPAVLTVVLLAGALVGVLGVFYLSGRDDEESPTAGETTSEPESDRAAIGRAAGRAADELESAEGLGNAVYRAWAEMTAPLPVDDPESSTPAEFATAAVEAGMPRDEVTEVTALFEEVRYGGSEPSAGRERRAVEALRRIEAAHAGDEIDAEIGAKHDDREDR